MLKVNSDGSWTRLADLSKFLVIHPVVNPNPPDFEPDGTWFSLLAFDGNLYAVEPNHGEVDVITPGGIVTRLIDVSETQGHVVPTTIALAKSGFYIANLDLFPISPGDASRYAISTLVA